MNNFNENQKKSDNNDEQNKIENIINKTQFYYLKIIETLNPKIYNNLKSHSNFILLFQKYSEYLIGICFNDNIKKSHKFNEIRFIDYLSKLATNEKYNIQINQKKKVKYRIGAGYLLLLFYLFKYYLELKKIEKLSEKSEKLYKFSIFFDKIIKLICISFVNNLINKPYLETIVKFIIILSQAKTIDKIPSKEDEIIHMIFFSKAIKMLNILYSKIYSIYYEFSEKEEELMNDIILFIREYILGTSNQSNNIQYINKVYLANNDYNISKIMNLTYIIMKMNHNDIKKNFTDLLSDIFFYAFNYNTCIGPTFRLLEPLLLNLNKKELYQINDEINVSDFTLSFINSLIEKEENFKRNHPFLLNGGFFFGGESSIITHEITTLDNDFIILLGFSILPNDLDQNVLLEIVNKKSKICQIKIVLSKTAIPKTYEMLAQNANSELSTKILVKTNTTYIFSFHVRVKTSTVNISYIKEDNEGNNQTNDNHIYLGKTVKLKNFKNENLILGIGCEKYRQTHQNKFHGFIGDVYLINSKNIKIKGNKQLDDYFLNLKNDYDKIREIFCKNMKEFSFQNDIYNNTDYNSLIEQFKDIIGSNKILFKSINKMICSKFYEAIPYEDEFDYQNKNYEYYHKKRETQFQIKKKYLSLEQKSDILDDFEKLIIHTSVFNKSFHIFTNRKTIDNFLQYNGVDYLSLLLEYYYQILYYMNSIKNNNNIDEIKTLCQMILKKIVNLLKFFDIYIINTTKVAFCNNELEKFFYQLTITLLKFAEIDVLSVDVFKFLVDSLIRFNKFVNDYLIQKLNPERSVKMRYKLFDLMLNENFYQNFDIPNLENLNYVFLNLYLILKTNTSTTQLQHLNNILQLDIFKKIMYYFTILDNIKPNDSEDKKNNELFETYIETTRKNYINLIIHFLKISFPKDEHTNRRNTEIIINQKEIVKKKELDTKSEKNTINNTNINIDNIENESVILKYFFRKFISQRKNQYMFSNLGNILIKSELIREITESNINNIKSILQMELISNNESKRVIMLMCINILIEYYFANVKEKAKKIKSSKKHKEKIFHKFIRSLNLNIDLFYSLIYSFKYVSTMSIAKSNEAFKESKKIISFEYNFIDFEQFNQKLIDIIFSEINIKELNEVQVYIIKTILEDIIFLLYKMQVKLLPSKDKKKENNESKRSESMLDLSNNNQNNNQNIINEIFDILKKNIDVIFKYQDSFLYDVIFSSDNEICAELFYLKWKIGGLKEFEYVEKVLTKYHTDLLKNHLVPFLFKFIFFISNENLLPLASYIEEGNSTKILKFKATLLIFIIDTLVSCENDFKSNKNIYFNNLINFLVLLNHELNYRSNVLFKNSNFCSALYKYITLIFNSGLILSNYYMEINHNYGKIISETIYDIFFAMSEYSFSQDEFIKTFVVVDEEKKEEYSLFYIIDLIKSNALQSDKELKNKISKFFPQTSLLTFFNLTYFDKKMSMKHKNFLNKNFQRIDDVNFTMYILGKSFIYFSSTFFKHNNGFKQFLSDYYLPLLSTNIYRLFTRRNPFYGKKTCQKFPLYYYAKKYFESTIVQSFTDFTKYEDFFLAEMKITLKVEYNIFFCYASRLVNELRRSNLNENMPTSIAKINKSGHISSRSETSINPEILDETDCSSQYFSSNIDYNSTLKDLSFIKLGTSQNSEQDLSKFSEDSRENEEDKNYALFELIEKKNIIYRPRNYFFKIKFPNIYREFLENDETFKIIRKVFFLQTKKYSNVYKETKQKNYPVKQKNFSNVFEPRIFLSRDYKLYTTCFFKVSHEFIPIDILNKNLQIFFMHPHQYKYKINENVKSIFCELVTRDYIYFGKMYFFDEFLIFDSQNDPRDEMNKDNKLNIFNKYCISERIKDNSTKEKKFLIIYTNDIKEIIQKRTLLVNQSIEIFSYHGKSYFFNFFHTEFVKKVYEYLNEINTKLGNYQFKFCTNQNEDDVKNLISQFHQGKISCYSYLLKLNKFSTRTYNSLSQYPVFPWLTLKQEIIDEISQMVEKGYNSEEKDENFRDFENCMSFQDENKRNNEMKRNMLSKDPFSNPLGNHYSTSAYIYFYLMRLNPYGNNLIKLQNLSLEVPERMFSSFRDMEIILNNGSDNRELIPDLFCYCDFLINLNCCYYGYKNKNEMIDDFKIYSKMNTDNYASSLIWSLYYNRKLLNSNYICKEISKWVDMIFGKKQLPIEDGVLQSVNIYQKECYEQGVNLEERITNNKNNKIKTKYVIKYKKKIKEKKRKIYEVKKLNLMKKYRSFTIKDKGKDTKIPLYNPFYAFSYIYLKTKLKNKTKYILIILTCRYIGNYFKLQIQEQELNIFCESFVTCIKARNLIEKGDSIFYVGLYNGKLIKYNIETIFQLMEEDSIYCHRGAITCIEFYTPQSLIITAGEDKYINIRKIYNLELLTSIDLTYSYGNPIINKSNNIFPSLIKISDLNLIYILIYDYDSQSTLIRGYNMNGIFFAQTKPELFQNKDKKIYFNNISFTKCSNLVVGYYNYNKYSILQAWGLEPIKAQEELEEKSGTVKLDYDYDSEMCYLLYSNKLVSYREKNIEEQNP